MVYHLPCRYAPRSQFTQLVSARGIDGLITTLEEKNQALRQAAASGKG